MGDGGEKKGNWVGQLQMDVGVEDFKDTEEMSPTQPFSVCNRPSVKWQKELWCLRLEHSAPMNSATSSRREEALPLLAKVRESKQIRGAAGKMQSGKQVSGDWCFQKSVLKNTGLGFSPSTFSIFEYVCNLCGLHTPDFVLKGELYKSLHDCYK